MTIAEAAEAKRRIDVLTAEAVPLRTQLNTIEAEQLQLEHKLAAYFASQFDGASQQEPSR